MAEGKWLNDLTATTPLEDAARHVLTVRLQVVQRYLPLALNEADKDAEHVHQLRVGTRRARAALDIFAPCLAAKVYKNAKKELRRIRRGAGEARDWDVFLQNLASEEPRPRPRQRPGFDLLVGYALAQRAVAQREIDRLATDYPFAFDRLLAETVAGVQPAEDPSLRTLLDLAQPLLFGLVHEFAQAAGGNLDDYDHLHQVRIIGKRLRYAMEVFADCFLPPFRETVYPAVEEMQTILGLANDSHVTVERLDAIHKQLEQTATRERKRLSVGIAALRKFHAERLPRQAEQFKEWWTRWQETGGATAFNSLLKVPGAQAG